MGLAIWGDLIAQALVRQGPGWMKPAWAAWAWDWAYLSVHFTYCAVLYARGLPEATSIKDDSAPVDEKESR
jgi:hypothetical protein